MPNIVGDNVAVGKMAGEYLLDKGFEHFGYCGFNSSWSEARLRSFAETIENAGCQINAYEPPKPRSRLSSDILAIEDPEVAKALAFIQYHSRQHTQVDAVAEAVAMSRRNLHRRFMKTLGRTVHEEIRRARVERVVQMLLETDMTISQIAYELGWSSEKHIAREFKAVKGVTPLAFRKRHTRLAVP